MGRDEAERKQRGLMTSGEAGDYAIAKNIIPGTILWSSTVPLTEDAFRRFGPVRREDRREEVMPTKPNRDYAITLNGNQLTHTPVALRAYAKTLAAGTTDDMANDYEDQLMIEDIIRKLEAARDAPTG